MKEDQQTKDNLKRFDEYWKGRKPKGNTRI